jgi:hypothetical protein
VIVRGINVRYERVICVKRDFVSLPHLDYFVAEISVRRLARSSVAGSASIGSAVLIVFTDAPGAGHVGFIVKGSQREGTRAHGDR